MFWTYIEVVNKAFAMFLVIRIANQANAHIFIFYNPHNKIWIMSLKGLIYRSFSPSL